MRPTTAIALLLCGACASAPGDPPRCVTDNDCAAGLVCFADGCGDPTRGLVVEITGGATSGLLPQDFEVPELGTVQDFTIQGPLSIAGSFQRELTPGVDPTQREVYSSEVLVRATGESVVIPGVLRNYQARYAMADRGVFSMNVGQGQYTVTAAPAAAEVPPQSVTLVEARPDGGAFLNFAFPSVQGAVTLAGRLVKRRIAGSPPTDLYNPAPMDLQVLDPLTGRPLSARANADTTRGDFVIVASPAARNTAIEIVASPRDLYPKPPAPLAPSRRFTLTPPFPSPLILELGDFGERVANVPGTVLGSDGQPLAEATVIIEGRTRGGGAFRSEPVITDSAGRFVVDLLPPESSYTLTVIPPPQSRSAVTAQQVSLRAEIGRPAALEPSTARCQERIAVTGRVLLPDGAPAGQIEVRATELTSSSTLRPLPLDDVRVQTGLEGQYELRLDPGAWRIEFVPAIELPSTSRLITVSAAAALDGGEIVAQQLAPIALPRGRKVTGTIRAALRNGQAAPLTNAQVRFFRVTRIEGKPASVLLGVGITNATGAYSVILPTRDMPRQ